MESDVYVVANPVSSKRKTKRIHQAQPTRSSFKHVTSLGNDARLHDRKTAPCTPLNCKYLESLREVDFAEGCACGSQI